MISDETGDSAARFVTVTQAAEILTTDVQTINELIRSGELPAIRIGTLGPWRIERSQLEIWIEEQYESTRVHTVWEEGEYANVFDLSGARTVRLRPIE